MSSSKTEIFNALELLEQEKGIPFDYMMEKITNALQSALHREYGNNVQINVEADKTKKEIRVSLEKEVVEEVVDPQTQISLAEAKTHSKRASVGQIIKIKVDTKELHRLSAAAAKSVIVQGIREGERQIQQAAYESKKGEIITATVSKIDPDSGDVLLQTNTGYAHLVRSEQIPGETFRVDDKIKVFVTEVNKESRGPVVNLSRIHNGLVRRMFELEIPEITDGDILVKGVAREAGSRTKIAVMSRVPDLDPVGACIGNRGMRINTILEELHGEKIDIIKYSDAPEEYVAAALAPADVLSVHIDDDHVCTVLVNADQLSLAIGKEGQNARLAARLTGMKIDIKAADLA